MTREEATKGLKVLAKDFSGYRPNEEMFNMAITALEQPEIIRCGDCKWFQCNMRLNGYLPKGVDEFECRHWCGYCDPTDYCSYAERRES